MANVPRAPDRKDSTPRHGRLLHPSSWRNEMIAITPPKIFSKEVAQNRPPHLPRQQPPSPPKIVLRQISGDGAWMNFRFSRALPPGGLAHARPDDLEAFPYGLGHAATPICLRGDACVPLRLCKKSV